MRKLIPTNLCLLVGACADSPARYSITGVRIRFHADGYVADATDGHCLVRVEGDYHADVTEFPTNGVPDLDGDDAREGVIPVATWKAIGAAKLGRVPRPALDCVLIDLTTEEAALVRTNLDRVAVERTRLVDGRFPDIDAVLKDAGKNRDANAAAFDPVLFARVMTIVSKLGASTVEVSPGRPLVVKAETKYRQRVTALIQPHG